MTKVLRFLLGLFLVLGLLGIFACGESKTSTSRSSSWAPQDDPEYLPGDNDEPLSEAEVEQIKESLGEDPNPWSKEQTAYLFSTQQLNELYQSGIGVRPTRTPRTTNLSASEINVSGFASMDRFLNDFFRNTLQQAFSNSLRAQSFSTKRSSVLNAYAKGEKIVVHSTTYNLREKSVLAIMCHEIAHAIRYHDLHVDEFESTINSSSEAREFDRLVREIVDDQISVSNSDQTITYRHNESKLDRLDALRAEIYQPIIVKMKRIEAEADLIGMRYCAKIGLNPQDFFVGISETLWDRKSGNTRESTVSAVYKAFPDGGTVRARGTDPVKFLMSVLTPPKTHPSPQERIDQIKKAVGHEVLQQGVVDFATKWVDEFKNEKDKLPPSSNGVGLFSLHSGETLHQHKQHSCFDLDLVISP